MAKKKAKVFQTPNQKEATYKTFYLRHLNNLGGLQRRLTKLTPDCQKFFGSKPPENNENPLIPIASFTFQNFMSKVTRRDAWSYDWHKKIENIPEYQKVFELYSGYKELVKDKVTFEIEHRLEFWKEQYPKYFEMDSDDISESEISNLVYQLVVNEFNQTNESYKRVIERVETISKEIEKFQNDFDSLLEKKHLNKGWLAFKAFEAIWDGSGVLNTRVPYTDQLDRNTLEEIRKRLGQEKPLLTPALYQPIPNAPPFTYTENLYLFLPFEEYEKKAIEAYRLHLQNYWKTITSVLTESKHPAFRKVTNPHRIELLVRWNYSYKDNYESFVDDMKELQRHGQLQEFEKDKIIFDAENLGKEFNKLSKFDLPLRPQKNSI